MTNEKIIIKYLLDKADYYEPANSNLSIRKTSDGKYVGLYSYETLLAFKEAGNSKVYITDTSFSSTSAKHASLLRAIAQEQHVTPVLIPMLVNVSRPPQPDEVIKRFEARMDKYRQGTELALKVMRDKYLDNYVRYITYMTDMQVTSKYKELYTDLADKLKDEKYLVDLKAQRKEFLDNADQLFQDTLSQHF